VTEVTDSAPHSAVLDEIRQEIRSRIQVLGIVPRAGVWLWFDLDVASRNWAGSNYSSSDPARFLPRRQDRQRVLDEMAAVTASGASGRGELVNGTLYPTLSKYGVRLATGPGSFVEIGQGTIAYSPSSLIQTAHIVLVRKRDDARGYDFAGPLWLVLHITDRRGEFYDTAKKFAEAKPEIEPFDRVYVLYRRLLVTLDRRFSGAWASTVIKREP